MIRNRILLLPAALLVLIAAPQLVSAETDAQTAAKLRSAVDGAHRSAAHRARNDSRHPVETLSFFGLRDDMTVLELSPGGSGWYTEVLAPVLRERGKLIAASYNPEAPVEYLRRNAARFAEKLAAQPAIYDKVSVTVFDPPRRFDTVPPGTADLVVTFRNLHGWINGRNAGRVFAAAYAALKPGGVLGLVQHRAPADSVQDPRVKSGYVRQDLVIVLAEQAGFHFDASSEINANPLDTADHPEGVWTLPPGLRLKEVDKEKYVAIGESDRMTLRFVKPAE